jgi:eukaryotic-like serine/threonine-protein kinase
VIARCLEKEREKRFQNVGELALALAPIAPPMALVSVKTVLATLSPDGRVSSPSLDTSTPHSSSLAQTVMRHDSDAPVAPRRRLRAVALSLVGIGVAAIAATAGLRGSEASASRGAVAAPPVDSAPRPPIVSATPALPASASAAPPSIPSNSPANAPAFSVAEAPPPPRGATAPSPRTKSAPATKPAASAPPRADCDPTYYYDARGKKHFKPECFE